MKTPNDFARFIRRQRKRQGMTQLRLAELSQISGSSINHIEMERNMDKGPAIETVIRLLDVLGYELVPVPKSRK